MKYDAILSDLRRHGDTIVGPPEVMRAAEQPDARVGRYVVVAQLGQGGAGTVYRAWDPGPGRFVALKVLNRDTPAVLERFKREAQIAARLKHPGIVPVHEVGEDAGRHFIAMELIDGATADSRRMRPREAADVVRQAALAIHAAHEQGVIHRDVKPSNILIDRAGRAYVSDFGLARWVEASRSLTDSDMVMGTPGFMSPEQVRDTKRVDVRADVYGLGATLYRLSTGRVPHAAATTFETLKRTLEEELAMPRGVLPRDLEAVIQVAMAKEPGKRYATARALAEDLKRFLEGDPVAAHPPSFTYRVRKRLAKRKLVAGLGAVVVALAVVLGIVVPQWRAKSVELALQAELKPVEEAIKYARPYLYTRSVDIRERMARVREAVHVLETLAAGRPRQAGADVWFMVGLGRWFLNDGHGAEEAWHRALARDAGHGRAHYHLTKLYLERAMAQNMSGDPVEIGVQRGRAAASAEAARQHLRKAHGWSAGPLEEHLARAYQALVDDDAPRLLQLCREGLERFPGREGTEEYLVLRSWAEVGDRRVATLKEALDLRPHYLWATFLRANALAAVGRRDEALRDFATTIALDPEFAEAYSNRGNVRRKMGDTKGAMEDYDAAILKRPNWADGWLNRAASRVLSGDARGALSDYDRAVAIAPNDACVYACRGWARYIAGLHSESDDDYRRAQTLGLVGVEICLNRARAAQLRGDRARAQEFVDEAVKTDPEFAEARIARSAFRLECGDLRGTVEDCDAAIRLDSGSARAYSNRAVAKKRLGDRTGALADLDRAVSLDATCTEAWFNRANLKRALGDVSGALADYSHAIALEPQRASFYTDRGACRAAAGDLDGGVADLDEAVRLDSGSVEAHYNRGVAHMDMGQYDAAIRDFSETLRLNDKYAGAYANRGDVMRARGDLAGCVADFERALEVAPPDWPFRDVTRRKLEAVRVKLGNPK